MSNECSSILIPDFLIRIDLDLAHGIATQVMTV